MQIGHKYLLCKANNLLFMLQSASYLLDDPQRFSHPSSITQKKMPSGISFLIWWSTGGSNRDAQPASLEKRGGRTPSTFHLITYLITLHLISCNLMLYSFDHTSVASSSIPEISLSISSCICSSFRLLLWEYIWSNMVLPAEKNPSSLFSFTYFSGR